MVMAEIPVKEISELLDAVSTKTPSLLSGMRDTLYSAEAGAKMGQAVGHFYKELVEAGIPSEEALKMTKDYMASIKEMIVRALPTQQAQPET